MTTCGHKLCKNKFIVLNLSFKELLETVFSKYQKHFH